MIINDVIHLVDPSERRRASITHSHSNGSIIIVPYDRPTDLFVRNNTPTFFLVYDEENTVEALFRQFESMAFWAPVVAYSEAACPRSIVDSIHWGALDYLVYPFSSEELRQSSDRIAARACRLRDRSERAVRARANLARLTGRELEVVSGVADGLTNKMIAKRLFISPRTVEIHRTNALQKLGANTSTDAVRMVLQAADANN